MHQRKTRKGIGNKLMSVLMMMLLTLMMFPFTSIVQPPVAAYASEGTEKLDVLEYVSESVDDDVVDSAAHMEDTGYLVRAAFLMVDKSVIKDTDGINDIFADEQYGFDAVIGQYEAPYPIYKGENGLNIAYIGQTVLNSDDKNIQDVSFTRHNLNGEIVDGCYYDYETGIAYFPDSVLNEDVFGEEHMIESQLLVPMSLDSTNVSVNVEIENNSGKTTAPYHYIDNSFDSMMDTTTVQIATADTARNITQDQIHVYINDEETEYILSESTGSYNPSTGELTIAKTPLTITSLKVVVDPKNFIDALFGTENAYAEVLNPVSMSDMRTAATLENLDLDQLSRWQAFDFETRITYNSKWNVNTYAPGAYLYGWVENGRDQHGYGSTNALFDVIVNNAGYTPTEFEKLTNRGGADVQCSFDIPSSFIVDGVDFSGWPWGYLMLQCCHKQFGSNTGAYSKTGTVRMRVLYVDTDNEYAILGFVSSTVQTQSGVGVYKVKGQSRGNIEIQKSSTDARTDSNPNYDFNGIEYSVTNSKGENIGTIALDANGYGSMSNLKYDTYTIKETRTNDYFKLDATAYTEKLDKSDPKKTIGGKLLPTQSFSVADEPQYIGFFLDKESANPSVTANNKMYTLAGAEYTITNTRTGKVEEVMVTDDKGHAASKTKLLVDDYTVKETKATNKHFALDTNTYAYKAGTPKPGATQKVTKANGANLTDEAKVDVSLNIYKQEQQSEGNVGLGATTLRDAVYKIEYWDVASEADKSSATPEHHRTWYVRTDDAGHGDIQTITTEKFSVETTQANSRKVVREFQSDEPYRQNGKIIIPMGYIEVTEVSNPVGHFFDNGTDKGPGIVQKYAISNGDRLTAQHEYSILGDKVSKDEAYRGDYKFTKIREATQEALAGVPFLITSKTTGESHVVVTDSNGAASTEASWNSHIDNTNVNDSAFTQNADGIWVLKEGASLDSQAGVWFTGHGPKKTLGSGYEPKPKDSVGALPYDSYIMQELACEQNKGMTLVTREFTIERHGWPVDGNTISDHDITIQTTATDKNTGDHIGDPSAETVIITDEVSYSRVVPGTKYTMTGTLMDKKTGEPLKDASGNTFVKPVPFIPTEPDGTIVIEFEVPGSLLVGKTTVVFESLRDPVREVAIHTNINDEKQTIDFPGLHTTATDSVTGEHEGQIANEDIIVRDEVAYSGLRSGQEYEIRGTLMDKATNAPLVDADGNTFTANIKFTPDSEEGSVTLEFKVPRSVIAGKTVVAFEYLYQNNKEIGKHADIDDEEQTVYYPDVHTTATDNITGNHVGYADDTVTINDVVKYENLLYGKKYRVDGVLMDKATSEALKDSDGKEITASAEFVAGENPNKNNGQAIIDSYLSYLDKVSAAYERHGAIKEYEECPAVDVALKDSKKTMSDFVRTALEDKKYRGIVYDTVSGDNGSYGYLSESFASIINTYIDALPADEQKEFEGMPPANKFYDAVHNVFLSNYKSEAEKTVDTSKKTINEFMSAIDAFYTDMKNQGIDMSNPSMAAPYDKVMPALMKYNETPYIDDDEQSNQTLYFLGRSLKELAPEHASAQKVLDLGDKYEEALAMLDASKYDGGSNLVLADPVITDDGRVSGEVLVSFTASKIAVEGKQTVVFEELYGESGVTGEFIIVGDHKDISDEGQTVYYPEIKTLAHSDDPNSPHNAQIDFATNMVKFTDTITYKNLMPGEKYRADGVLMDKKARTELIDGNTNNKITASVEFVPESPDGTVDVVFEFDASNIGIDYSSTNIADTIKETVVFEEVYLVGSGVADDIIVGKHADLNDKDQSMLVGNFFANELIETGGEILPLGDAGIIVAALIAINAGLYAYWMRFRRKEDLA